MADDQHTTREVQQCIFERAQRIDVEIVGRFIEQQNIGLGFQHFCQMDAVALTAR